MPSATLEEYLETIYKLAQGGPVRPSRVAEDLGVSAPTVTAGLRRLEASGLITRPDGGVLLTERGLDEAVAIVRRHRLAERFLTDALGLSWDVVHEEACRLEHALSDRVLDALETFLEDPAVCPHGHPIPSRDGVIRSEPGLPMSDAPEGTTVTVVSVPEEGPVLGYMRELALHPGQRVVIEQSAPFEGPLLIAVGDKRTALDRSLASRIGVRIEE